MPSPPSPARRDAPLIRRATPADVSVAVAIIEGALADYGLPFEPDGRDADVRRFGARADNDDFVGVLDGVPAGIASVGPHGDEGVAWISKVFVAKAARKQGLGRALLMATHDAARARGFSRVGLRTRRLFREAIALYESEGYTPANGDPAVFDPGDVVYFRLL
jgi:putative acetyltransferase